MNQLYIFAMMFVFKRMIKSQITYDCDRNATCGCSRQPATITRMFGGENAANNSWGWTAIVNWGNGTYCSGTLISDLWVVVRATSMRHAALPMMVSAGTNTYWNRKQVRSVSHIIRHPGYSNKTLENDIALLRVSPPFDMSDPSISIICLPNDMANDFPALDTEMIAIGWGANSSNGPASEFLQQAKVKRITASYPGCYDLISRIASQFCTIGIDRNITFYPGDSGGSMMEFSTNRQWLLAGIIMGTGKNVSQGAVTVNTRVFFFLDWIKSTMSMNFLEANITHTTTVERPVTIKETTTTIDATNKATPTNDPSGNNAKQILPEYFSQLLLILLLISFSF